VVVGGGGKGLRIDPNNVAHNLHHAMKGVGTDEKEIIKEIAGLNKHEIAAVKEAYNKNHGSDLIKKVESETSFNFRQALVSLLLEPAEFDARTLHESMSGVGTKDSTLIEILATRSYEQKQKIKEHFYKITNRDLEKYVDGDTSGDYKKALVALLTNKRQEGFNPDTVKLLVDKLYHAGEGKIGTDEKAFIHVFSSESFEQLKAVFEDYKNHHKHHSMEHAIKSEFSFHIQETLLAVLYYATKPAEFWAEKLRNSMAGLGTKDTTLIRVLVSQREHMPAISAAFLNLYKKPLESWIKEDCSGDYKHLLVEIVRLHSQGIVH